MPNKQPPSCTTKQGINKAKNVFREGVVIPYTQKIMDLMVGNTEQKIDYS